MPISWNVEPSDIFVVNNQDGTFDFKPNTTTSPREYRIIYTDNGGCTGETTYTIPTGNCNCDCTCNNISLSTTKVTLGSEVGSTDYITISFTGSCFPGNTDAITIKSKPSWVDIEPVSTTGTYKLTTNEATDSRREGELVIAICGQECTTKKITIEQDSCKAHWSIASIYTPETRATHTVSLKNGKGGISFMVYHDGERVDNLTQNDFTIEFSNQGATLNEIIKPAQQSDYIMNIDTDACGYRGQNIDVIISIKDKEGQFEGCEDIGRLCFTYGEKIEWTVEVEGLTTSLTDIGFIGYTSEPCAESKIEVGGGALPVAGGVVKGKLLFYEDMEIIWNDPANNPYDWDSNIPSGVKPLLVGRLAGTGIDDNPHRAHVVQIGNTQTPKYIKVKYQ